MYDEIISKIQRCSFLTYSVEDLLTEKYKLFHFRLQIGIILYIVVYSGTWSVECDTESEYSER